MGLMAIGNLLAVALVAACCWGSISLAKNLLDAIAIVSGVIVVTFIVCDKEITLDQALGIMVWSLMFIASILAIVMT